MARGSHPVRLATTNPLQGRPPRSIDAEQAAQQFFAEHPELLEPHPPCNWIAVLSAWLAPRTNSPELSKAVRVAAVRLRAFGPR